MASMARMVFFMDVLRLAGGMDNDITLNYRVIMFIFNLRQPKLRKVFSCKLKKRQNEPYYRYDIGPVAHQDRATAF